MHFVARRPWLWIVAGFAAFLGAWAALIAVAGRNQPQWIAVPGPEGR